MTAALGLAPLRAWEDFFGRFSRPGVKDLAKWKDRVVPNLLYYQTNYFAAAAVALLALLLVNPVGTATAAAAMAFWSVPWARDARAAVRALRRRSRLGFTLASVALSYALMSVLWAVALLGAGMAFQLVLVFAHASLRRRSSAENRTENTVKQAGLERSPMAVLLAAVNGYF